MIGRFGICVVAASLAGLSVSAEVSGYVTPEQDVMSPFFERALDAYYCAEISQKASGGVGLIDKTFPVVPPENYLALGQQMIDREATAMSQAERDTLPMLLGSTARFQYDTDLKVNGGSEGLFLLKTLPRCEQFFVANSRLD